MSPTSYLTAPPRARCSHFNAPLLPVKALLQPGLARLREAGLATAGPPTGVHRGRTVRDLAQALDLVEREGAELPALQATQADGREALATKLAHGVANRGEHAAHETVAPLGHRDLDPGVARVGRTRDARAAGCGLAVFEHHAILEPAQGLLVGCAPHLREVALRHAGARVRELVGEVPVVGEQQHTLGVDVEAADGLHARGEVGQQREHGRAPLGVVAPRDEAGRLVEDVVHLSRRHAGERAPVEGDPRALGDGVPGVRDPLPVDVHTPLFDHALGLATARHPTRGDHLGQPAQTALLSLESIVHPDLLDRPHDGRRPRAMGAHPGCQAAAP